MSETNNRLDGWGEYQRLVLAELERHSKLISDLDTNISEVKLQTALREQEFKRVGDRMDKMDKQLGAMNVKLDGIQIQSDVDDALHKYRNWLLSGAFLLLTAFLIPLVKLFLGG